MRRRRKRIYRKQPRRLTPPLFLRDSEGNREAIEVDQELFTVVLMQSTRTTAYLQLSDGLRIQVGSRCINKRRVPAIRISPANYIPPEWKAASPTFGEIRDSKDTYE